MSSAYGSLEAPLAVDRNELARVLPVHAILKDGTRVVLEQASATLLSDEAVVSRLNAMLNYEIDQGNTYPQEFTLDRDSFKAYFLSAAAFVLRAVDNANEIIGTFYVKPNYPGRCSHICNGGFITANEWRGKGVGKILANTFLTVAPLLGYKASVFNLVFASNTASVSLWRSLGFTEIGRVPKAGRLKGSDELIDAIIFYYDFEQGKIE